MGAADTPVVDTPEADSPEADTRAVPVSMAAQVEDRTVDPSADMVDTADIVAAALTDEA
jgi:hypothetical protein